MLVKVVGRGKKRLGRGYGSGKGGHTVGRGQKGQKARGKVGLLFEGVKVKKSLLRRLPQVRGKDKFKGAAKPVILTLGDLNELAAGSRVNLKVLVSARLVDRQEALKKGVKILDGGALTKKLIIEVPVSQAARKKVLVAGGKVI